MNCLSAGQKSVLVLLVALLFSLVIEFLTLIMPFENYLPVSILSSLIFFGTAGIIIGYRFKSALPWGLIILVGIIRFFAVVGIHGVSIYDSLLSLSILAIFIDLGSSLKAPQIY